jgi:hypothetical protein
MSTETVPVVFRLPKARLEKLQSIARRRAVEKDERYTLSDLCREALDRSFPETTKSPSP